MLALASTLIIGSESHMTYDHILQYAGPGSLQNTETVVSSLWQNSLYVEVEYISSTLSLWLIWS